MGYTTQGNGPALLTSCIVCLVLTWVFFAVRIYTRVFLTKLYKIEDWLFVASQLSFTVYAFISLESTLHGNGQLNKDINEADIPIAMHYFFWGEILYVITALLMRLSIGFFILRIITQKGFIWTVRIKMGLITLATVMDLFYTIFQCAPIKYFWLQFSGLPGKCLPAPQVQAISITYSAASAVADILFSVLPICVLWNLQMNRKAKIIVGVLLCVGIVVIVRIKYIVDVSLTEDFMFATAPTRSANRYFKSESKIPTNQNSNFGLSRNHSGYMKSVDSKEMGSYEDSIALQSLATGPGAMGVSGRGSEGDDDTKGILTSTTVEITRHQRRGDDNV
ncbi:hypothetical protein DL95DRAFT_455211 [Leptodontidium sp. 2 PMI_412]|nr:hypothetical protein DL95DRAFT_455211 [Leptodontidium sp. 2 PMI_412]